MERVPRMEMEAIDPMDNPFSDIAKWTSMSFKVPGASEVGGKKRKTR